MTRSFRTHLLFKLFAAPRSNLEPIEAVIEGASDNELAHLTIEPGRRIDNLRYSAISLIYGGKE